MGSNQEVLEMRRILVTQSDREATQEVTDVLMEQGFKVENAYNIEDALQKVQGEPWDLIILDIRVPQGDGFEACQYVREHTTTPVPLAARRSNQERCAKRCTQTG